MILILILNNFYKNTFYTFRTNVKKILVFLMLQTVLIRLVMKLKY